MAVNLRQVADGKIVVLQLSEKLTKENYQEFVPEIERLISQEGKIRMLCELNEFHGWEMGALWQDIKFDARHWSDIERLAIVGEKKWHELMSWFCKPFTSATIRYFDKQELERAYDWIREGVAVEAEN